MGIHAQFTIEDNILKGPEYVYPEEWSGLGKFVYDKLSTNANFCGQFDIESGTKDTYEQLKDRSVRCAVWMRSKGVKRGDVVAIFSVSHWDVAIPCFASQYLGAIFHPLDPTMSADELAEVTKITKPKMIFATQRSALVANNVSKAVGLDARIVSYGRIPGYDDYNRIIQLATEDDVEDFECEEIPNLDEIALIVCCATSAGSIETFTMTHRTVFRELYTMKFFDMEEEKFLSFSQIYTVHGVLYTFGALFAKKTKYLVGAFDHTKACRIIERYKNDLVHLTDYACEQIVKFGVHRASDLSSVKRIVCGGGRNPLDFHKKLTRAIPHVEIFYGFGITDIAGSVTKPCINMRPGSCGRVAENAWIKVVDLKTGETLKQSETGELYVKSPYALTSYYKGSEATAALFDDEGWLRTGDVGYYDENGEVFLVGRRDEAIKYKDTWIYPRAIEAVFMTQSAVQDVAVVGLPHPTDNEHPIAFVVKMADAEVTEQDLLDVVVSKVPEARGLPGGVHFVKSLPKTLGEVVKRGELKYLARSVKERENIRT